MNDDNLSNATILSKLIQYAKMYRDNLENKNILFVFKDDKDVDYIETEFLAKNFQHLTGVKYRGLKDTVKFYELCLDSKLEEHKIKQTKPLLIKLKFNVLSQTMKIHKTANMIGSYNGNSYSIYSDLETKKLAGSQNACLGFIPIGDYFIPNTNLDTSIFPNKLKYLLREDDRSPILLTFRKNIEDKQYTELTHVMKKLDLQTLKLPKEILEKINVPEFFPQKNEMVTKILNEKQNVAKTAEDFDVNRLVGEHAFTVRDKDNTSKKYKILHGDEHEEVIARQIASDFNVSEEIAKDIFSNAIEKNALEDEVKQDTSTTTKTKNIDNYKDFEEDGQEFTNDV
ncbi:MAG: hypothetical protein LBM93_12795 [Oscillospiraceae bacterium]|jgi:hypothetical protein|nr:hypothetical protein [Oscillospiraceae bacterium]